MTLITKMWSLKMVQFICLTSYGMVMGVVPPVRAAHLAIHHSVQMLGGGREGGGGGGGL